jgi:hypothetical protein
MRDEQVYIQMKLFSKTFLILGKKHVFDHFFGKMDDNF